MQNMPFRFVWMREKGSENGGQENHTPYKFELETVFPILFPHPNRPMEFHLSHQISRMHLYSNQESEKYGNASSALSALALNIGSNNLSQMTTYLVVCQNIQITCDLQSRKMSH